MLEHKQSERSSSTTGSLGIRTFHGRGAFVSISQQGQPVEGY